MSKYYSWKVCKMLAKMNISSKLNYFLHFFSGATENRFFYFKLDNYNYFFIIWVWRGFQSIKHDFTIVKMLDNIYFWLRFGLVNAINNYKIIIKGWKFLLCVYGIFECLLIIFVISNLSRIYFLYTRNLLNERFKPVLSTKSPFEFVF